MAISTSPVSFATARSRTPNSLISEATFIAFLGVVQFALRAMYLFHHSVDSDEPQHLHVIWGWTHGLVQYRDLFDNHAPLFHLALAPIVALLGDRADIVVLARMTVLPLVGLTLWATYRLGEQLWSSRVGVWAALLAAFDPTWMLTSSEFRADILWMAAWACALLVLLGGTLTVRRAFIGGLWLGIAFAASLKSVLLLAALTGGVVLLLSLRPRAGRRRFPIQWGRALGSFTAGMATVPALMVVLFWAMGALPAMLYCTIQHNLVPNLGLWHGSGLRMLILPALLLVTAPVAHRLLKARWGGRSAERRVLLLLTAVLYFALLHGFWPLVTAEDSLPWVPMVALIGVAGVAGLYDRVRLWQPLRRPVFGRAALLAVVVVADLVSVTWREFSWKDSSVGQQQLLSEVLRLTRPHEPIMDLKGETVFRPRPYYFVLEGVTKTRLAQGSYADRIAYDVQRTRTHFATLDAEGFPPAGRRYLNEHFIAEGRLRVLGADLERVSSEPVRAFEVSFPERFVILANGSPGRGMLDGLRYRGARLLQAGQHQYRYAPGETHTIAVWERSSSNVPQSLPLAGIPR